MAHVTTEPSKTCQELEKLRRDARLSVLRASNTNTLSQFGAAERKREADEKIDALIQHLLVGHAGEPCPAGSRPIVKPSMRPSSKE